MNEKLKALLKKAGFTDAQIADLSTDDKEKIEALEIDPIYDAWMGNMREVFENDPSFTEPIKSAQRAEVLSSKERKIMKLYDISKEEYDALPKSTRFDSLVQLAHDKLKGKGGDKDSGKKIEDLNQSVLEWKQKYEKLEGEEVPKIRAEVDAKKLGLDQRHAFRKIVGKHETVIDSDAAFDLAFTKASDAFDFAFGDDKKLGFKLKGKDEVPFVDNAKVTPEGWVEKYLTDSKLIKQSNGKEKDKKTVVTGEKPEYKNEFPGMNKAQEAVDRRKQSS